MMKSLKKYKLLWMAIWVRCIYCGRRIKKRIGVNTCCSECFTRIHGMISVNDK